MFEQVQRHADFFRVMLGAKGDPAFVEKIRQYSEMRIRSLMPSGNPKPKPDAPPLDLCLSYLAHAGVGGMAWWLKDGMAHSPHRSRHGSFNSIRRQLSGCWGSARGYKQQSKVATLISHGCNSETSLIWGDGHRFQHRIARFESCTHLTLTKLSLF